MPHTDALIPNSEYSEPPLRSPLLYIGKNRRGCWVVRDQSGLRGGLFVSRAEAFRFAMFENGRCLQAIVMVPGLLELDMSGSRKLAANEAISAGCHNSGAAPSRAGEGSLVRVRRRAHLRERQKDPCNEGTIPT